MTKRTILHVSAGTPEWNPTTTEIEELGVLFQNAIALPDGALVVTRSGVTVKAVEVEETVEVRVVSVHVSVEPELLCARKHDLTREEAIGWAIANNLDFKSPVLPPPQGWMWSCPGTLKHPSPNNVRTAADLILTPIFTNTEDADITISDINDTTQ